MQTMNVANYRDEFVRLVELRATKGDKDMGDLLDKMKKGDVILTDHSLTVARLIGGSNAVRLIDPTVNDDRSLGLRNFDKSRLDPDKYFMPVAVQLLAATNLGLTTDQLRTIAYSTIADVGAAPNDGVLVNGEINFRIGNLYLLQDFPLRRFNTIGNGNKEEGMVELNIRRIIKPNNALDVEVRFPAAAPADYGLRLYIHGLQTVPNAA